MQIRNFNSELMFASILFSRLFRNITILRAIDQDNVKHRNVEVNCVIGNRSRIFKHLDGTEKTGLRLPAIVITRTGISVNSERTTNLHNEIVQQNTKDRINYNLLTPVPLDIEFSVVIASRWQSDIDMILSNIIPFFNQDLYVACRHPKYYNVQYYSQVVMGSNVQQDAVTELSVDQDDIVTATLTFTFKTYLFGGNNQIELTPTGGFVAPITKISPELHAPEWQDGQDLSDPIGLDGKGRRWRNEWDVSDFDGAGNKIDWNQYFDNINKGDLKYPEYDTMRWIIGIDDNGGVIVDPNIAYGFTIAPGDGTAYVPYPEKGRMLDDTTHDNYDLLGIQNRQRMPYVSRIVRPYTQEEIDAANGYGPDNPGPDDGNPNGFSGMGDQNQCPLFDPANAGDPGAGTASPTQWDEGIPDENRSLPGHNMEAIDMAGRAEKKKK